MNIVEHYEKLSAEILNRPLAHGDSVLLAMIFDFNVELADHVAKVELLADQVKHHAEQLHKATQGVRKT